MASTRADPAPLKLVEPAPTPPTPRGIDIADVQHREIKARDWHRVHLEGDRNPPLAFLSPRRWRFSMPSPIAARLPGGEAAGRAASDPPVRAAGSDSSERR